MEINKKVLGQRIKMIRLSKGETMEEFGLRFNTSKGTVNNWEKERNKPNKTNLKIIADIAEISVDELVENNTVTISKDEYDKLLEIAEKYEKCKSIIKEDI